MWFILIDNAKQGPFEESAIRNLIVEARVNRLTQVWRKGFADWKSIEQTDLARYLSEKRHSLQTDSGHPPPTAGETLNLTLPDSVPLEMSWIPPGRYLMGSPKGEFRRKSYGFFHSGDRPEEETQKEVVFDTGFYLGKTLVTREQWNSVMPQKIAIQSEQEAKLPVVKVSYSEAKAFADCVGEILPGYRFRLPSQEEWEYACRAGTTTPWYSGSTENEFRQIAWYAGNSNGSGAKNFLGYWVMGVHGLQNCTLQPVGLKKPNQWGLCDMHGNAWEWCSDVFIYNGSRISYVSTADLKEISDDYARVNSGQEVHIVRGGSYRYSDNDCRSARRAMRASETKAPDVSFRLAL